ncbi:MAG TPA: CRTAC1 family protein [Gemmataceae bacterium]|nr:CRTAC1 family protein [Gemmataceae bacterium]
MIGPRCGLTVTLALAVGAVAGCQGADPAPAASPTGPLLFRDATEQAGLSFVHDAGPLGDYFMPQIVGSGAALFDFDNDSLLDIYLLHNAGPGSKSTNRLFHQEQGGRFRDVSTGSGLDIAGYGMGVAVGDINNDGWPDVLVTQYGGSRLFRNNRDNTFTDITRPAGLDLVHWGTSASFVDYDRDGWLDLVIVHYLDYYPDRPCTDVGGRREFCPPQAFPGTITKLFHNLGDKDGGSRFEDVTLKSGLGNKPGPGLGIVCADFNGDHWPDILIANDRQPNYLWINQHDGTFHEEGVRRGVAYNAEAQPQGNMGVAIGDVDGDLRLDLFITHLTEETHTLWRQTGPGLFQDRTAASGLAAPRWRGTGFGTAMADFNNDGAADLAVVNGRVMYGKPPDGVVTGADAEAGPFWSHYADRNQLFLNTGQGGFRDISPANDPFCGRPGVFRGLACGDIDNDGGLDLLVTSIAGPARLFKNIAANRGHWLLVRAIDPDLHRDAYGAEVTVKTGDCSWKRWLNPGYSYLCSNDPRLHFGLGQADRVESIEVLWPNGDVEEFRDFKVDRSIELRKGSGTLIHREKASP